MRLLAILAAAAMLVSLFLPWTTADLPGLAGGATPWDLLKQIEPTADNLRAALDNLPWQALAVLATFPLAALFLLLALFGLPVRILALLAGGIGVATVGWGLWQGYSAARDATAGLGVELPTDMMQDALRSAAGMIGAGGWAWGVGALVLFLAGLIGFGRRRY
jgi:hypothetical protein